MCRNLSILLKGIEPLFWKKKEKKQMLCLKMIYEDG